jgi:aspartate/methionine/tyrosine aminotransferase
MTQITSISKRSINTDFPTIGAILSMAAKEPEPVSTLCQGMVHWIPPVEAVAMLETKLHASEKSQVRKMHSYTLDFGNEELREALRVKIERQNKLNRTSFNVIVTQGANQGFASIVSCLCDAGDSAVLFKPYYFNHLMALQLSNVKPVFVECRAKDGYLPDPECLEEALEKDHKIRIVVVCNPCNPTGAVYSKELLDRISQICQERGIWLICDEAYEYFMFDGATHYSPQGDHILHLYSFSKAFGLAGWRVGYIVYPLRDDLELSLGKYQDTVPICCSSASQQMALECLRVDGDNKLFTTERIATLVKNRELIWDALSILPHQVKTNGAIYFWCRFPNFIHVRPEDVTTEQEWKVVEWLIRKHRIAVLPGSCFGECGSFRISFANLLADDCAVAAAALKRGLQELADGTADIDKYALSSGASYH